jgi:hypothetical protein
MSDDSHAMYVMDTVYESVVLDDHSHETQVDDASYHLLRRRDQDR